MKKQDSLINKIEKHLDNAQEKIIKDLSPREIGRAHV